EQNDELAICSSDRHEPTPSQLSIVTWFYDMMIYCYWYQLLLISLGLSIGLSWQWLILVLVIIGIRIVRSSTQISNHQRDGRYRNSQTSHSNNSRSNRNRHVVNGIPQPSAIVLTAFILFAAVIILTYTPLEIQDTQPHDIIMPNNMKNMHQNLSINNENSGINAEATLYNNSDDDITTTLTSYEANIQAIVRESIATEAVDNATYNRNHVDLIDIETQILLNYDSNEENEQIFSSEVEPYMDDEDDSTDDIGTGLDSDNDFYTNSGSDSNDDQTDDNDDISFISHISYDTTSDDDSIDDKDEISVSIDSSFGTSNENDWSINNDETDIVDEVENKTPLDRTISAIEQSVILTLSSDSSSDQTLKIKENADTLIDIDRQEMVSSTDPNNMDSKIKTNSVGLNEQLNEDSTSPQAVDDSRHIRDPDVGAEDLQPNHDNNEEDEEIADSEINLRTDDKNDDLVHNDIQRDRVSPSSELLFNNDENNIHFDRITTTDIHSAPQTLSMGSSSDQSLQIEQKPVDQTEVDHQNLIPSTRATSIHLQKHPNSVDSNEESSKKNVP
ncbi:unnamed protein product, partial [Rotaria sp. Silwood1]